MQVPYPLISLVSRMPMTLHGRCPLTLHTRTFETTFLSFASEKDAIDVFESVKELTVASESSHSFHSRASPRMLRHASDNAARKPPSTSSMRSTTSPTPRSP